MNLAGHESGCLDDSGVESVKENREGRRRGLSEGTNVEASVTGPRRAF